MVLSERIFYCCTAPTKIELNSPKINLYNVHRDIEGIRLLFTIKKYRKSKGNPFNQLV